MKAQFGVLRLTAGLLLTMLAVGCSDPAEMTPAASKQTVLSPSTPSNNLGSGTPASGLIISCPATATVGGAATCGSTLSGNFSSLIWMVNGLGQPNSNVSSYTWTAIETAGTYRVQLVGRTSTGTSVSSNTVDVVVSQAPTVNPPTTLSIVCPATATVGANATCTASSSLTLVSGYWTVNGLRYAGSDNVYSYTWTQIPSTGTYRIQGIGFTSAGVQVRSNEVSVVVSVPAVVPNPQIAIACPSSVVTGQSGTCAAISNVAMVAAYWTVDGVRQANSDSLVSFTWNSVPTGTFRIQAVGQTSSGLMVRSNELVVDVAPLVIACPLVLRVGETGSCTAVAATNLVSGYWMINGVKVEGSDNLLTLTTGVLAAGDIGTHTVQAIGFDAAGVRFASRARVVQVQAR